MEEKTEGLLLQATPYLGNQKILKVFTSESGCIHLICKKKPLSFLANPFVIGEWVYKKGKEDLHVLQDATITNGLESLKQNYERLLFAGKIAQDILKTQLAEKKGKDLYLLAVSYFEKLSLLSHPENLHASFRMKLLLHEGLIALYEKCSLCEQEASFLVQGESFCSHHATVNAIAFSSEDWNTLLQLTYAKKFSSLDQLQVSKELYGQIDTLFNERQNG